MGQLRNEIEQALAPLRKEIQQLRQELLTVRQATVALNQESKSVLALANKAAHETEQAIKQWQQAS